MTDRELDALVDKHVFGKVRKEWPAHDWKKYDGIGEVDICAFEIGNHNGPRCVRCGYGYCTHCEDGPQEPCVTDSPPYYSTHIDVAWSVVEKMRGGDSGFSITNFGEHGHWVGFGGLVDYDGNYAHMDGGDVSAPRAICLAALNAKGVKV